MENRWIVAVVIVAIVVGSVSFFVGRRTAAPVGAVSKEEYDDLKSRYEELESRYEELTKKPEPIKIGQIWPTTGGAAESGKKHRRGVELRVEEYNKLGGIRSLGGAEIELVSANNEGDPKVSKSEAERLITTEDINTLIGCYTSATTEPTAEVAQRYEIPMTICAGKPTIPKVGDYIFRAHSGVIHTAEITLDYLEEEVGAESVSILMEDTGFGRASRGVCTGIAEKMGIEIKTSELFPGGTTDFSAPLLKIKDANPDALLWVGYISESLQLMKQMRELDVNVDAIITPGGGGFNDIDFVKEAGEEAEYTLVGIYWSPYAATRHNKEFVEKYEEKYGEKPDALAEEAYEAASVLIDAIERAGSRDPKDIRDSLANTHMRWTAGPIDFDEDGFNINKNVVVTQVQNGEFEVVYPSKLATAESILPMPTWEER